MADVNETLAGISAFIREAAQAQYEAWMNDPNDAPDGRYWSEFLGKLADRIDAAAERGTATNCNRLGNAAALREALLRCDAIAQLPEVRHEQSIKDMRNIIKRALAAPPRNCDRPEIKTLADAIAAASKEIRKPQELHDAAYSPDMFVAAWLLAEATAKEGEKA